MYEVGDCLTALIVDKEGKMRGMIYYIGTSHKELIENVEFVTLAII